MSRVENFGRAEWQANFFVLLAKKDDEECIEQGYGRYVDLWQTERICIEGIAKIYGETKLEDR